MKSKIKNIEHILEKCNSQLKSILSKVDNYKISRKYILEKTNNLINYSKNVDVKQIKKIPFSFIQKAQDLVENKIKSNPDNVVLQQPIYWTRGILWSLIGGTIFGVGWLTFAETEEIVVVVGKLEPKSSVANIQIPMQGIAREILVKEGDHVNKGDVLIRLDTDVSKAQNISLKKRLEISKDILRRLESLMKEGAISEVQYFQQKKQVIELESEFKQSAITIKYQEITSPVNGMVFDLKAKGEGYVAQRTEPIMKIVPFDKLQAKVEIDSRKIGFITVGKKASISIDSFPSSDFGVIGGEITKISSDALPPDPSLQKGYRFPADIRLEHQYLKIKNGKKLPLQPGMSLTANIKLRKVSYMKLLLNTFTEKADSLRTL
tara:strand:+ start:244 stop:1374 length:1131 start_codon:yes stop_codon:yes gene_type:complete